MDIPYGTEHNNKVPGQLLLPVSQISWDTSYLSFPVTGTPAQTDLYFKQVLPVSVTGTMAELGL